MRPQGPGEEKMKILVSILSMLMFSCARVPLVDRSQQVVLKSKLNRVVIMSTGYQVDVPENWSRTPNGSSEISPSFEELTFEHTSGAGLKIVTTSTENTPLRLMTGFATAFSRQPDSSATEPTMCLLVEDGVESTFTTHGIKIRVVAVGNKQFTYIIQGFSRLSDNGDQDRAVEQLIHNFKVIQ